ncbi:putative 1-phosphatidylinositol 3-phosphate 5-kinase [Trichonephila inaurata madagascariensis]|uniref:Putative 1-phosphatidylinositol 3-phosphate 5-kinase n=1 Tax=Trichonephila inaurata madagascariensis TaxID=2747483 RepID=A0A8X7CEQ0_9ARAC|nr:putative 1-phosphatidylinositol 3-phosphate 5-kinase [Trichonephila inaurata madagascariensis]
MNPFGSSENVTIDGTAVKLPVAMGNPAALSASATFQKPNWMPDTEADSCLNCDSKFSQFRRKHHCRNCGKIFCNKCCLEKIPLPHFGINEPEKVCNNCKLIVELMNKTKSSDMDQKYEAVVGLSSLMKNSAGLSKTIECGGINAMLSIAINGNNKIKSVVASALHSLAQSMMLNSFLVEAGCLKVLKNFLSSECDCIELLSDSLSALNLLCMDSNIRIEVLKEGMIEALLNAVISSSGVTSVFASRVLQLLVCNFEYHDYILQNHRRIIPELFDALQNEDYQLQACVTKMLMYFSAGSVPFRDMIIQEDVSRDFPLLFLLKGSSQAILVHVACIVANLAVSVNQNYVHNYIAGICELLTFVNQENEELLGQIGRGLANFAESPPNSLHLIRHLPTIISNLLKSSFEVPRVHACRLIVYLFSSELPSALDILSQSGLDEFIETVFDLPGLTDILNGLFLRKVSRLSVCQK